MVASIFSYLKRQPRYVQLLLYFGIGLTALLATVFANLTVVSYGISGGAFGTFCSLIVLWNIWKTDPSRRSSSTSLLFWRAFCDCGVGLRFLTGPLWNKLQCGHWLCQLQDSDTNCWAASAMLEFFELSSEAWFLCVAVDLAITVTDPFSSPKQRVMRYHILCWVFGLAMALTTGIDSEIYGTWFITDEVSKYGFCWIQNHTTRSDYNYKPYVMFYIPLILVYVYSLYVIVACYQRLKTGISKTFQHRVKMLTVNAINVFVYFLYWTVAFLFYALVNQLAFSDPQTASWIFNFLIFTLSAKGYADLIVFVIADEGDQHSDEWEEQQAKLNSTDFNAALREEVLHFATTGIRVCAQRASKATENRHKVVLSMTQSDSALGNASNKLSPWFFIKVMFASQKEANKLTAMMIRETSISRATVKLKGGSLDSGGGEGLRASITRRQHVALLNEKGNTEDDFIDETEVEMDSADDVEQGKGSRGKDRALEPLKGSSVDGEVTNALHKEPTSSIDSHEGSLRDSLKHQWSSSRTVLSVDHEFRITEMPDMSDGQGGSIDKYHTTSTVNEKKRSVWSSFFRFFDLGGDNNVKFTEYEPFYFRLVRQCSNVDDAAYKQAFKNTIKERLTEGGASGAFFFFSKGERFIAKSCTEQELETLIDNASKYANYLSTNRDSYITRIFGAYKLHIYGTDLNFFVMNNIFLTRGGETINEKYDLKGSWVARNAKPPRDGQRVPCTFCNQTFVYHRRNLRQGNLKKPSFAVRASKDAQDTDEQVVHGDADRCPFTVLGHHEPNVILKDNDLKHKIRLPTDVARKLLSQLKKDAEFLCSIGIMDYSLLVGVHTTEYAVEDVMEEEPVFGDVEALTGAMENSDDSGHSASKLTSASKPFPLRRRASVRSVMETSYRNKESESRHQLDELTRRLQVSRVVGPEAYYIGIVDFQQKWDWNKKLERALKLRVKGEDPLGLSSIEPIQYRDRFIRRMEELLNAEGVDAIYQRSGRMESQQTNSGLRLTSISSLQEEST